MNARIPSPDRDPTSQARPDADTPAFWLAMFAASAFGTNLGDFWSDFWAASVNPDTVSSLVSLAVLGAICLLPVWLDQRAKGGSVIAYWGAIIVLRAAATDLGDLLTHDLALGYGVASLLTAVLTMLFAKSTRPAQADRGAPLVDPGYWLAMSAASVFGTVAGDMVAHSIGVYAAAISLGLVLMGAIAARRTWPSTTTFSYWLLVMLERTAATPFGDTFASHRGLALGLPVAMVCTSCLCVVGLLVLYRWQLQSRPS